MDADSQQMTCMHWKGEKMTRGPYSRVTFAGFLVLVLFACTSCIIINAGDWNGARYEKEVDLSAPLATGSSFSAETRDGSINVQGVETDDCKVLAKIVAHARTEEQAQELAEQVAVRLEPAGAGLKVVTEGPRTMGSAWYGVSLDVKVPVQTSLILGTDDGSVHLANITGSVDAGTSDGSIEAEALRGDVKLRTSDGRITGTHLEAGTLDLHANDGGIHLSDASAKTCTAKTSDGSITLTDVRADSITAETSDSTIRLQRIAADRVECHTSDGSIHIDCAPDAPKAPTVTAATSDAGITFIAPPDLSAVIDASTTDGSIHTSLPITIKGKVGKSLTGTVGGGEGKIHLRTYDGSITIR
jgi:DUF4097 and DUF4098 domain-containing protein YvlB